MAPTSPAPTPDSPAPAVPPSPAPWRRGVWLLCAVLAAGPLGGAVGLLVALAIPALRHGPTLAVELCAAVGALLAATLLARAGFRRGWPARNRTFVLTGAAAAVVSALVVVFFAALSRVRDASRLSAMLPSQPAAAADQFFRENPYRIFVRYDEVIGPSAYVKQHFPVDGEDLRSRFPLRRAWSEPLPVTLPDGTTVRRIEVIAVISRSGLVATYPRPQDNRYVPGRVYRLDDGVCFRDGRVVDLPPDPAGREGRDQDGVHRYRFPDGRRFEITYRDGRPDGPFRAYHADGALWGEATYRAGRVVAASLLTRDGRRLDELADGEAAHAAVAASCAAAARRTRDDGLGKLAAGDFAGAIAALSRALDIDPVDRAAFRARAEAYRALGNLDRALADFSAAAGYPVGELGNYPMSDDLHALVLQRGRQRRASGAIADATRDFTALAWDAHRKAADALRDRDPDRAIRALDPIIAVAPLAELHGQRAAARRTRRDRTRDAEADYSRAIELAADRRMLNPSNRLYHIARWHYERGHVRRWIGDFTGAAADFGTARRSVDRDLRSYAALWCFVAQCEAGRRDDARRELQAVSASEWSRAGEQIAACLRGEIPDSALDASLLDSRRAADRINADLLPGLMRRLSGDEAGALERIRRASRRATRDEIEAEAATVALDGK